jgi:hypothetical protein
MTYRREITVTVNDQVIYRDQDMLTRAASHRLTWRECSHCGALFIGEGREDDCELPHDPHRTQVPTP